jgi:hypothetical protein
MLTVITIIKFAVLNHLLAKKVVLTLYEYNNIQNLTNRIFKLQRITSIYYKIPYFTVLTVKFNRISAQPVISKT